MPRRLHFIFGIIFIGAALVIPRPSQALSLCSLLCSCTIATNPVNLGSYNPINNQAVTAASSLTVNCQLLSGLVALLEPFTVSLSKGQANSFSPRQMIGPSSNMLNYNLYSDAGMSVVWGDGTGISQLFSSSVQVSVVGVNVGQTPTIYAQIPGGQNVKLGSYSDTITATLQF